MASDSVVAEYSDCTKLLRNPTQSRYMRTDFVATNISSNGHQSASGALDPKVLCNFSRDGVCARGKDQRASAMENQRAVLQYKVHGQLDGSFRSTERALQSQVNRSRKMQVARCEQLLQVSSR